MPAKKTTPTKKKVTVKPKPKTAAPKKKTTTTTKKATPSKTPNTKILTAEGWKRRKLIEVEAKKGKKRPALKKKK